MQTISYNLECAIIFARTISAFVPFRNQIRLPLFKREGGKLPHNFHIGSFFRFRSGIQFGWIGGREYLLSPFFNSQPCQQKKAEKPLVIFSYFATYSFTITPLWSNPKHFKFKLVFILPGIKRKHLHSLTSYKSQTLVSFWPRAT